MGLSAFNRARERKQSEREKKALPKSADTAEPRPKNKPKADAPAKTPRKEQ